MYRYQFVRPSNVNQIVLPKPDPLYSKRTDGMLDGYAGRNRNKAMSQLNPLMQSQLDSNTRTSGPHASFSAQSALHTDTTDRTMRYMRTHGTKEIAQSTGVGMPVRRQGGYSDEAIMGGREATLERAVYAQPGSASDREIDNTPRDTRGRVFHHSAQGPSNVFAMYDQIDETGRTQGFHDMKIGGTSIQMKNRVNTQRLVIDTNINHNDQQTKNVSKPLLYDEANRFTTGTVLSRKPLMSPHDSNMQTANTTKPFAALAKGEGVSTFTHVQETVPVNLRRDTAQTKNVNALHKGYQRKGTTTTTTTTTTPNGTFFDMSTQKERIPDTTLRDKDYQSKQANLSRQHFQFGMEKQQSTQTNLKKQHSPIDFVIGPSNQNKQQPGRYVDVGVKDFGQVTHRSNYNTPLRVNDHDLATKRPTETKNIHSTLDLFGDPSTIQPNSTPALDLFGVGTNKKMERSHENRSAFFEAFDTMPDTNKVNWLAVAPI